MGCKHSSTAIDTTTRPSFPSNASVTTDLIQHTIVNDISKELTFTHLLGKGAFGTVHAATCVRTGHHWAVKKVELSKKTDREALRHEMDILKHLHHPNIVKVVKSYEDKSYMYMVMQLCTGKALFDHVYKQKVVFSEKKIRDIVRSLARAVAFLHANDFIHRDLKLENVLLENASDCKSVQLCDFGFSRHCLPGEVLTKTLGTVDYVSPEVLEGSYDAKCDVWSIGVITYELISRTSPFRGSTQDETLGNILDGKLNFEHKVWKEFSSSAQDFIRKCCHVNVNERVTADQALTLPWLAESFPTEAHESSLTADDWNSMMCHMQAFSKSRKIKQTAMLSVALGLTDIVVEPKLREVFHTMDILRNGTLNQHEFTLAVTKYTKWTAAEVYDVFIQMDQTNSKNINYLEFLAATLNPRNLNEVTMKKAFATLDTSQAGKISTQGLQSILKSNSSFSTPTAIQAMIDDADLTGDGCLNYEEFKSMFLHETPRVAKSMFGTPLAIDTKNAASTDDITLVCHEENENINKQDKQ